jgi:hypothetical protein
MAREWLKSMRLTPRYYIPSMAALLARVQREERERAKRIVGGLQSPDAEEHRKAEGDSAGDRYWLGWTDALDSVLRRLDEEE